jgi:hypothetical protein
VTQKVGGVIYRVRRTFFHADTLSIEQFLGDLNLLSREVRFDLCFSNNIVGALCAAAPPSALVAVGPAGLANTVLNVSKVVGNQVRARSHALPAVVINPE